MSFPFSTKPVSISTSFSSFGLHPDLQRGIAKLGFETPTPIQETTIPLALNSKDIIATAATGSGKTAAFLLPIMHRILDAKQGDKRGITRALILTPTRELAAQITEHLAELARFTTLRGAAIFGGVSMGPQRDAFLHGADIMVATPGRLLDHFSYPYGRLNGLDILVLDEADRMLDMGFLPDIRKVLRHLPQKARQTLFFSATMPDPIVVLSREILKNPVPINIERQSTTAEGINQTAYPVPEMLKSKLLLKILEKAEIRNVLAFTRTKHRANRLAQFLAREGISSTCIHGNRSQSQRTAALADFKAGKCQVLVATDIAARGIDIEALSHVINFDVPHIAEDYIHRVGRTARAKLTGDAMTFIAPHEEFDFKGIERHIGRKIQRVLVDGFDYQTRSSEALEVPLAQRIAEIRAKKAADRTRSAAKAACSGPTPRPNSAASKPRTESRPRSETNYHHASKPRTEQSPHPNDRKNSAPAASRNTTHRTNQRHAAKNSKTQNTESVFARFFD